MGKETQEFQKLITYNLKTTGAVLTDNNVIDILKDGQDKFRDLIREMKKAKSYIHIQYYIIKDDELFRHMIPLLVKKVQEGVDVRILYDRIGGRFVPESLWKKLRKVGILTGEFSPELVGKWRFRINYRNHRKIVVIDGKVGYVGGFNIGREYISRDLRFGYWRDTHLKLQGDAAVSLQIRFALDWNYATKENLLRENRYLETQRKDDYSEKHLAAVQIITSGPNQTYGHIRNHYLQMFHTAKKHIYIQTPYFIPDEAVMTALQIAVQSGVAVYLMIPCKPDHPLVYWATWSYMGELLKAGARCYCYTDGFLHAKGVMVDGQISCYGTANMDIRSFRLNFEVNAAIYDSETTRRLEQIFLEDLKHCRRITMEGYRKRDWKIKGKEMISRPFSPIL